MHKDMAHTIHSVMWLIYLGIKSCWVFTLPFSQSKWHFVLLIKRLDCVREIRVTILLSVRKKQTARRACYWFFFTLFVYSKENNKNNRKQKTNKHKQTHSWTSVKILDCNFHICANYFIYIYAKNTHRPSTTTAVYLKRHTQTIISHLWQFQVNPDYIKPVYIQSCQADSGPWFLSLVTYSRFGDS